MSKTILIEYLPGFQIKCKTGNKNGKDINLKNFKKTRVYIENTYLIAKELEKINNSKNKIEEKILIKNFFGFLVKSIIDENNFLVFSFQKIFFKDFEIDLNIDEDFFYFEIFDKNKKRAKSETEKYYSLLKWDYVDTKTFIYYFW